MGVLLTLALAVGRCSVEAAVGSGVDAAFGEGDELRNALRMRLDLVPGMELSKALGALPKAIAQQLRVWNDDVTVEDVDLRSRIHGYVTLSGGETGELVKNWGEVEGAARSELGSLLGDNLQISLLEGDADKATLLLRGDVPAGSDGEDATAVEREVELVENVCEGAPRAQGTCRAHLDSQDRSNHSQILRHSRICAGGALAALFSRLGYPIKSIEYSSTDAERRARVLVAISGLEAEVRRRLALSQRRSHPMRIIRSRCAGVPVGYCLTDRRPHPQTG